MTGEKDDIVKGSSIGERRVKGRLNKAGFKGVASVECGIEEEAVRSLAYMNQVLKEPDA
ncbi:MAG: hypothetical protein QUV05_18850 [Phycisphaerae bacterium]|nr:hypothetical protein [Phycisphaerae bacterium]